jgi:hypothetical protein
MSDKKMQLPQSLVLLMRDALRAAERDSRRDDRVLHNETRDIISQANDEYTKWQDARMGAR